MHRALGLQAQGPLRAEGRGARATVAGTGDQLGRDPGRHGRLVLRILQTTLRGPAWTPAPTPSMAPCATATAPCCRGPRSTRILVAPAPSPRPLQAARSSHIPLRGRPAQQDLAVRLPDRLTLPRAAWLGRRDHPGSTTARATLPRQRPPRITAPIVLATFRHAADLHPDTHPRSGNRQRRWGMVTTVRFSGGHGVRKLERAAPPGHRQKNSRQPPHHLREGRRFQQTMKVATRVTDAARHHHQAQRPARCLRRRVQPAAPPPLLPPLQPRPPSTARCPGRSRRRPHPRHPTGSPPTSSTAPGA